MGKIAILHTNDIHSHFEQWNRIKQWMIERKKQLIEEGYDVLCVDVGDFSDRIHPLTEATHAQFNINKMNGLYDFVTFGNNEGIGNSHEHLKALYEAFEGTCVMSHCIDLETGESPHFVKKIAFYTTKTGEKIAFLGGTALYPKSYEPLGWHLEEPIAKLQLLYEQYKDEVDGFVLLSHFGRYLDHQIATECPWLQIIVGGHTHHLYEEGKWDHGVLLTSCQKHGHYCGEIHWDIETGHRIATTYSVDDWEMTEEILEETISEVKEGEYLLSQVKYGVLDQTLSPQALLHGTTRALAETYHYDVVFLHDGLFVEAMHPGEITAETWHHILPHPLHLMDVWLKGSELKRLLFEMDRNHHFLRRFHLVGMGFRGKKFGCIQYYGLSNQNGEWQWKGHPIEDTKDYHFLTLDHYEFVPFFPTIAYAGKTNYWMDCFLRGKVAPLTEKIIQYGKEWQNGEREERDC